MSRHRPLRELRRVGILAGALLLVVDLYAQTPNGFVSSTDQVADFEVKLLPGEQVGHEQIIRGLLKMGTNEFLFVAPDGLRTQKPRAGIVVLISGDMSYYLSIRSIGPAPANSGLKEALQERINVEHPRAGDLEAFTATVADREGTGFQLREKLPGLNSRLIRTVWVPFNAGVLEFGLNADTKMASAAQSALDMLLLTFRSNERGKIVVVRRSEKT